MNQIDLNGRRAVVTGGAQGIGFAVAERLIASGASVAIWDVDTNLANQAVVRLGVENSIACPTDVTQYQSVESSLSRTEGELGPVDIIICNAGIAGPAKKIWEYEPDEWRSVIDIDLSGVFNCLKAVSPGMISRNYGRICSTASIAGKEGNPNAGAYSAAKAGVIALTKSLAKELAGYDIAVNCITPAAAKTAIFDQISQEHIDYMLSKIPRGRFVKVEEIAAMVAWLVSSENSFTTGAAFDLSGGRATY